MVVCIFAEDCGLVYDLIIYYVGVDFVSSTWI